MFKDFLEWTNNKPDEAIIEIECEDISITATLKDLRLLLQSWVFYRDEILPYRQ